MKMKIFIWNISLTVLFLSLSSCHSYTEVSYRLDRSKEYIKENGYMISCKKDHFSYGDVLIVGTYTPDSLGDQFYYGFLGGIKSDQKVKIQNSKLKILNTNDTLSLKEIRKEGEYIYCSDNLKEILKKNKELQLTIFLKVNNDTTMTEKTFLLKKNKHTYLVGSYLH